MNNMILFLVILVLILICTSALPINPTTNQLHSPPSAVVTTIPAFPEQSDSSSYSSGCPLDLPNDLNLDTSIKSACTGKHSSRRSTCCPVLAAWLYYAYSATALAKQQTAASSSYYHDLPLLPNDSETCIANFENGLRNKGIDLMKGVNQSCDFVYCECGIRLHPFTCNEAFSVNSVGELIGNHKVKKLEKDCFNNTCSKCLKTLHLLNKVDAENTSKSEERMSKMRNEDCELMGLTWLLAKNRSAYIHTVTAVLRTTMMNTDVNSIPQSCTLDSDRMPLAVDSSQLTNSSSSNIFHSSLTFFFSFSLYVFMSLFVNSLIAF